MYSYISKKSYNASFVALGRCWGSGKLTLKIGFYLFDTHVVPLIEYANEIWSNGKESAILEGIQLTFIKILLGVK